MPVNFTWEENGLYWYFEGILDGKGLMYANGLAIADPRFEEIQYIIWDSSNIKQYEITKDDAEISAFFAESVARYNRDLKQAFITQDDNFRSLAQYYIEFCQAQGVNWEQKIFNDIHAARSWLGH